MILASVTSVEAATTTVAEWKFSPAATAGLPAFWGFGSFQDIPPDLGIGNLRATSAAGGTASTGPFGSFAINTGGNSNLTTPDDGTYSLRHVTSAERANSVLITIDTTGLTDLVFSVDRIASASRPWFLAVSGDGTNFSGNLLPPTPNAADWFRAVIDLSTFDELENNPVAYFSLSSSSGASSLDNVSISATTIPEPSAALLVLSCSGLLLLRRSRS